MIVHVGTSGYSSLDRQVGTVISSGFGSAIDTLRIYHSYPPGLDTTDNWKGQGVVVVVMVAAAVVGGGDEGWRR